MNALRNYLIVSTLCGASLVTPAHAVNIIASDDNGEVLTLSGPRTPYLESNGDYLKRGDIGTLRPGSVADLLIVDGNPLSSLDIFYDAEKNIKLAMTDGIIYKTDID